MSAIALQHVMESTTSHLGSSSSSRRQGPPPKKTPTSNAFALPDWAREVLEKERQTTLAQPWKTNSNVANCEDDPNFAQGKDAVMFFDKKVNICFGEGSMAA